MDIVVENASPFETPADALLLPVAADLATTTGPLRAVAGWIDAAALAHHGRLALGEAFWVDAASGPAQGVLLMCIREGAGEPLALAALHEALAAGLHVAQRRELVTVSLALPAPPRDDAGVAAALAQDLRAFRAARPELVIVADPDRGAVQAVRRALAHA